MVGVIKGSAAGLQQPHTWAAAITPQRDIVTTDGTKAVWDIVHAPGQLHYIM